MRLRNGLWVLLALACVIVVLEIVWFQQRQGFRWLHNNDFIEYWSAGQLLRGRHNPYDFSALHELQRQLGRVEAIPLVMWNPPWLLVLLYPLLILPFGAAVAIWLGLSLGMLLGCTLLIWGLFVPWTSPRQLLVPLLATVIFTPALFTLRMGQVSVLILLGIVGFLHFEGKRKDFWAGASLVLLTLKPHVTYLLWIAVLWWIATRKHWKVLWGLGGTLLFLCAFLTLLRPTWALDYVSALRHPPLYWRPPVLGTVLRILFGWDRAWLQYLPTLILGPLVLAALHSRRAAFLWRDTASPLLLLSVPTAAYGWSLDQLVLLLPYLQVVAWLRQRHQRNLISSLVVPTGLLPINGLILWANHRFRDDLYLLWGPLAWGLLYLIARWTLRCPRPGAAPAVCGEERA